MSQNSKVSHSHVNSKVKLRKMMLTAMFAGLALVLSTFVTFPNMAPFQHFVNVLAGVFVGPWYALAAAVITGSLRMALEGKTILAISGAIFGAFLSGLGYKLTGKIWVAYLGEMVGTGIISALVSYPIMKYIFGLSILNHFYFYIPFFLPSSAVGGLMAVIVLLSFRRSGLLKKWLRKLKD